MISDRNSDRCKFPMPNTFACSEELFPTAVAERLLVNVWRWGLKLLPKTKVRWQHFQSLTQTLAKILCLTYPCDTPSLTAILCHVTITWWEAIIITVCSKSCWSFSYIVHIHSVHGFGEKDQNVKKWKFGLIVSNTVTITMVTGPIWSKQRRTLLVLKQKVASCVYMYVRACALCVYAQCTARTWVSLVRYLGNRNHVSLQ